MPINSLDDLIASAKQTLYYRKVVAITTVALNWFGLRTAGGIPGGVGTGAGALALGNTTTGLLLDDTLSGAFPINTFAGGATGHIASVQFGSTVVNRLRLVDALWGAGAVNLAAAATTTFSGQPSITGRLPGASAIGTELWLEISTAVTTTAPVVTISYQDQDNAASTTGAVTLPAVANLIIGRWFQVPLAAGDEGVLTVNSIQVNTAGAAGACNVYIVRPLWESAVTIAGSGDSDGMDRTFLRQVYDTSCILPLCMPTGTGSGSVEIAVNIASN